MADWPETITLARFRRRDDDGSAFPAMWRVHDGNPEHLDDPNYETADYSLVDHSGDQLREWLRSDEAAEAFAKTRWAGEMPHKPEWIPHAWEMAESLRHARRDLDYLLAALDKAPSGDQEGGGQ